MAKWGRKNRKSFEPVSAQEGVHVNGPSVSDLTIGDYANGVPNIRIGAMFKAFFKQLPWMAILILIGFGIAHYMTKDLKRSYSGEGRLLVQFSDDYAYNPIGQNGQNSGLSQTIDTVTLTEAAIMKNGEIIDEVINQIGRDRIAPDASDKVTSAPNERERKIALMELRNEVGDAYLVMPQAKSSIIDVAFKHEDPDIAVETANAFIDEYLAFRRLVFVEGTDEVISERRQATEDQLDANERAIVRFLKKNNISDFTSEQAGLQKRTEDLKALLNTTRASISETEGALARVEDQLRATPKTINIYVDDRVTQRVSQTELELKQLLAKYLPTSDPVRQKQTELDELRSLQSSYGGKASGGRRVGPNPGYQDLTKRRNLLASTADSFREREYTLQRQLNSADAKIRRMTSLTPEYQNLLRERATLNTRLDSYNAKEQEALVDASQSESAADNVKVISWAQYPNKGRNTQLLMLAFATLGWGVCVIFLGLIVVFLSPELYTDRVPHRRQHVMADIDEDTPHYDPIPEAVPEQAPMPEMPSHISDPYDPVIQPEYNPAYTATISGGTMAGGAMAYGAGMAGQAAPVSTDQTATAVSYDQYGRPQSTPYQSPYGDAPQANYDGNTAYDLSHNPYAAGEVQAGALQANPMQTVQYDEYGRPIVPYT